MSRKANLPEERVIRALRQAGVITTQQGQDALTALEATELCNKCNGTGRIGPIYQPQFPCDRCDATGQMRVIR